ncbi:hypothetical protein KGF57_003915 [Candida theae]|uniref:Interferon-related developmental regulator N-terminal domain-containing protein n=1 Tax=Candida theae TaxID=1198502 RepID=A0AAD5FXL0_9ASCO|nr:uncharacterized protein KGF57_003915 [Candida theae]KAI5954705.1 hypothetical protein KGF57_003915 [Candida theae]
MTHRSLYKGRRFDKEGTLSASSSRATSAVGTPIRSDDSDYESDHDEGELLKIEEILRDKLTNLSQQEMGEMAKEDRISAGDRRQYEAHQLNNKRIQENSSINDIIKSLTFSRTDISSRSRELLLAQLYKVVVSRPLVVYNEENVGNRLNYVDEDTVNTLIGQFTNGNYRRAVEFQYLYRSLIALICSDIDEFGALISNDDLLTKIEHLIAEPTNSIVTAENKSSVILGYTALTVVLHNGSSSFGVDDKVNMLMEVAEGYSASALALQKEVEQGDREHSTFITDKNLDKKLVNEANAKVVAEASVAVAALHGVGCLLTLLRRGEYLNEISEDLMIKLVPLLDNDENRDIAKAAGRTIAIIYELYDYGTGGANDGAEEEGEDEDYNLNSPYYEQESLISILTRLLNLSSKKVSKKDKKEISSVFRNIINTIETYTDGHKRDQVYKKTEEGIELLNTCIDSINIKLSKYKQLKINSWYLASRLRHLKWCFSFGLHSQLVANESIRDVLKEPDNEYSYGSHGVEIDDIEDRELLHEYVSQKHSTDEKSRHERRKKERMAKIDDQLDGLNLNT